MTVEQTSEHFHQWGAFIIWIILYGSILLFLPFHRKSGIKPKSSYLAFIIAFAFEMFGIPFSLYFAAWAFKVNLPEGLLWGHTLYNSIGYWGMYLGIILMVTGTALIISGWNLIYKDYWSRKPGEGHLVKSGVYAYIRHPQYTGIFLITLGMMAEWLTLGQLLLWPVILIVYIRQAKKEERQMEMEFGMEYVVYKDETGMFFPKL
ncbi:MAG: isoprenylcysteine carboxylmethyltransferase family protein [Sphaerochaetaceae bacterium]|nr:isoprenylcysteine carboxylmethyltransferase family protein [Sphaerochaetaceae bacterium]